MCVLKKNKNKKLKKQKTKKKNKEFRLFYSSKLFELFSIIISMHS